MNGEQFEFLRTPIPGPRTRELAQVLQRYESRNVTYIDERFPVFWETSLDCIVTDVDGNRYIDLTAAFGVANSGHSNPYVAAAIGGQAVRLMHAMGDVHPSEAKTELLEKIAQITPGDLSKTFLASTGAEAIEAAMKTAMLATGKSAFAAYRNSYHGLSLGALSLAGIERFKTPFGPAIANTTVLLEYPQPSADVRKALESRDDIAALFIEPIQGRGGCIVPPAGYLSELRKICSDLGILLVFDEIYTGFGRTGTLFACEHEGVVPDILCIGKAMANGFPISATVARPAVMDAWPASEGEALHTSTYLGNPMACAAALANIHEIQRMNLPGRAREHGKVLASRLEEFRNGRQVSDVRGRGLMWGLQLKDAQTATRVVHDALRRGIILLQAGPNGDVLSLTPPLTITRDQLLHALDIIGELL